MMPTSRSKTTTSPVIVIDTREQDPLVFSKLQAVPGTLTTGDYSVAGLETLFAVERKSIPDLLACCMGENREPFERELHRLRGLPSKRLLIVGSEEEIWFACYRSAIKPQAVIATLGAFEARYDLPVVVKPSPGEVARQIERWAYWFAREVTRAATNLLKSGGKEIRR